jgi:hypothetical protein
VNGAGCRRSAPGRDGPTAPGGEVPAGAVPSGRRAFGPLRLRLFDRHLRRVWRRGLARRDADLLADLRRRCGGTPVASVTAVGRGAVTVAEIGWADGFAVRVAPCAAPAVAAIGAAVGTGTVRVARADHYRGLWCIEMATSGGRLTLLAGSIGPGGTGGFDVARPRPTLVGS